MTSTNADEVVRDRLDAFSSGNLDRMLATLDSTAMFATGTTLVDPDEFSEFFGWAMRELTPSMSITSLVSVDDQAACEFIESVTIKDERQHLRRFAFYRVANGLVTEARVYDLKD